MGIGDNILCLNRRVVKLTTHILLLPQLPLLNWRPMGSGALQFNKDNFNIIWAVKIKVARNNGPRHKDIQEHKRQV